MSLLTRSPGTVALEQFGKLYYRLYPYLIIDFAHKEDVRLATATIYSELQQIKLLLQTHVHPVSPATAPGLPQVAAPTITPVPPASPSVVATEAIAASFVLPGLVPQPLSGEISLQPSRFPIGGPLDAIAIPPINPLDPTELIL
jgi:hypothetical protein